VGENDAQHYMELCACSVGEVCVLGGVLHVSERRRLDTTVCLNRVSVRLSVSVAVRRIKNHSVQVLRCAYSILLGFKVPFRLR
jgi:hypothetical protein